MVPQQPALGPRGDTHGLGGGGPLSLCLPAASPPGGGARLWVPGRRPVLSDHSPDFEDGLPGPESPHRSLLPIISRDGMAALQI